MICNQIVAGGGGGVQFASGEITLSSNANTLTISNIGFTPTHLMVFPSDNVYLDDYYYSVGITVVDTQKGWKKIDTGFRTYNHWTDSGLTVTLGNTTTIKCTNYWTSIFNKSVKYYWYAIG